MAIAFDAFSSGNTGTAGVLTFSHTCTGSNRILFVGVHSNDTSDVLTSVTYNGVAMTEVNKVQETDDSVWSYLYFIVAPATGANDVVATLSTTADLWARSTSYTGAAQTGQPDANATGNANTPLTVVTTTIADNCWVVFSPKSQTGGITAGTGYTDRAAGSSISIGDSNGPKTPAGDYSMTVTDVNGPNAIAGVAASFAPFVVLPETKTWNGIAIANIKTYNGIAIANIKTFNSVA